MSPQTYLKNPYENPWKPTENSENPSIFGPKRRPPKESVAQRRGDVFSLCAVRIGSGRRHQIRCHVAHIGAASVADGRLGRHVDAWIWFMVWN